MASPICLVNNQSTQTEVSVDAGSTVTIALEDAAGVNAWSLVCISADEQFYNLIDGYTDALIFDHANKSATITVPDEPCALMFESKVNQGQNSNGEEDPALKARFMIHVPTEKGLLLGAVNETTEANAQLGFTRKLNQLIRLAGA